MNDDARNHEREDLHLVSFSIYQNEGVPEEAVEGNI
jgi:hypothetical protein